MSKKRSFKEIREHVKAVIERKPTEEQMEELKTTFEQIEVDYFLNIQPNKCEFCFENCYTYYSELGKYCHEDCLEKMIRLNQKAFGTLDDES